MNKKNKFLKTAFLLAYLLAGVLTASASIAYDFEVDGIYYKKYSGDSTVYVTFKEWG